MMLVRTGMKKKIVSKNDAGTDWNEKNFKKSLEYNIIILTC
jgi:hypothetical protein